jgi:hypothetical protein
VNDAFNLAVGRTQEYDKVVERRQEIAAAKEAGLPVPPAKRERTRTAART